MANGEAAGMPGESSDGILPGVYAFAGRNFDTGAALKAMLAGGDDPNAHLRLYPQRPGLAEYLANGYVPDDGQNTAGSLTLEYENADFSIAQFARSLGNAEIADRYSVRAGMWTRLFDPDKKYICAQGLDGNGCAKMPRIVTRWMTRASAGAAAVTSTLIRAWRQVFLPGRCSMNFTPAAASSSAAAGILLRNMPAGSKAMRKFVFCVTAVAVLLCGAVLRAQCTLRNLDLSIFVKAGSEEPDVVRLSGGNGYGLTNRSLEPLPAQVKAGENALPLHWAYVPAESICDQRKAELVYESTAPHLRARWIWEMRSEHGPAEHRIVIENLSGGELWLPHLESLHLGFAAESGARHFSVEKGADTPSAEGVHDAAIGNGFKWIGRSSNYARPNPGEPREIIPIQIVYQQGGKQTGWYAGLEFSGRTRILYERNGDGKGAIDETRLGLNPEPGPYRTRLAVNGSFETPTVFIGVFAGGPDGAGNQLRPWVRQVLGNPLTWKDRQYPLLVNNSWGSGMQVDEATALRMIADSKELGLEMFHLDAGWFRGVGDWYPDPKKFPHGLAPIAETAHEAGLRFGLWTDWTQAGTDTAPGALNVFRVQNWLSHDVAPDWKTEEFKGQTIDIGVPEAQEYAARELKRIVESYHLDMLEHDGYLVLEGCTRSDHPHAPPNQSTVRVDHDSGFDFVAASNSTDVSYHATRAYYALYEQLRRVHPGLLFEICNDGGRMVDFGSAAHGDYFSITDSYDPLSNRRAFYDASYVLPAAMLESYLEKWPAPKIENFLYMLRSGMMGWTTIMLDTTAWNEEQHGAARRAIELYKSELRPLIRDARLFHVSARPDGVHWDGIEYFDAQRDKGVLYAFHGDSSGEPQHTFVLRGLRMDGRYTLHFADHSAPDREATGDQLMKQGIAVTLPVALSSELVFINEAGQR